MIAATHLLLLALALPATLSVLYLLLLTLLSRAPEQPAPAPRGLRFDIVVPAHDEASAIAAVVRNLLQMDWPAGAFRVLVVADNCSDATATQARTAGAEVLERCDPNHRGKGYALAAGFQASRAYGWAQAVVVVDADTEVSANLLQAFAARIALGATAMQAHYGVRNAMDSWRTRLLTIAMSAFHRVRSRAREHLGLSCGIRGNGWCITHQQLLSTPYRAFSLTEDLEFGIDLGLRGQRVHYTDEAEVVATMVSGEQAASTQRQRWESGRWRLIRLQLWPLLQAAFGRGSAVCADLALDLLVPPLAYVALDIALLVLLAGLACLWQPAMQAWLWLGIGCALGLLLHVLRGWQLSGTGTRGLLGLLSAPFYVLWKVLLMLRTRSPTEWVRTGREPS
jgi:cellulose synthase/poly-beta-1,6-N-acetylglucosamine synthase-like glycosyltransferase